MKKYKVLFMMGTPIIKIVNIQKETEKTVVLEDGRRENKITEYAGYFDTFEQAQNYLIDDCWLKIEKLGMEIKRAKGYLGNAKGLREQDIKEEEWH